MTYQGALSNPILARIGVSLIGQGPVPITRIFIDLDPVLQTHFPIQNTKTYPNDFDLSIDAVLPIAATTVTLYGQVSSADNYIKVLSTGFVSINIDTSIVTSTVLATKDSKQRRYGVKVVGDDFIFTEEGITIDTVTDAVAAAKSLIINVIAQSNGADFFDGTLSDPILTDLITPSNSVAWQLNLATGNTEQAVGGGNDLTYNGAPDSTRELFTFNQSDNGWDGSVERVVGGDFNNAGDWVVGVDWAISGGVLTATNSSGTFTTQASVNEIGNTFSVEYDITRIASGQFHVRCGFSDSGTSPVSVIGHVKQTSVAGGNDTLFITTVGATDGDMDNLSVKIIIEIA